MSESLEIPITGNLKEYRRLIWETLDYHPTPEQLVVHDCDARIRLITGGEGSGKSMVTAMEGFLFAPRIKLIWVVGNEYGDTDKEFEYMQDWFAQTKLLLTHSGSRTNPPAYMKLITGCEVVTKAVKDPVKIGSESPDLILVCEAARIDYLAYLRLRGRVARNRGHILMSGTLEDSTSWYPEFATRWSGANPEGARSFSMPTWANFYKYPGGRQDPEILKLEAETPNDIFLERYAGIACKPANLVIPEFTNAIHVDELVQFNPDLDVNIAVDPGYSGACSVLAIQRFGETIYVIDEVYLTGYVTEQIIDICRQKLWWKNVKGGVIDFAGRQHQAMPAPVEVWQDKAKLYLRSKKISEEAGIDLLRTCLKVNPLIGKPKIYFNPGCAGFISECGGGKSPVGGGAWMRDKNLSRPIDKNNHSSKALIYYLVDLFGYTEKKGDSIWGKIFRDTPEGRFEEVRR